MSRADVDAIARMKHEYCFTIDRGQYDAWPTLFTEDGRFVRDNGDTYEGQDELAAFAHEDFDALFDSTAHVVTNPVIDVDGDRAEGEWYLLLFYRSPDGDFGFTQAWYDDTYRKVDGEWRIEESRLTYCISEEF